MQNVRKLNEWHNYCNRSNIPQNRTEKQDLSWEYVVSLQLKDLAEPQAAYWKIFLQKVPSRFGEAEIAVWKVLLGPMQTQPF